VDGLEEPPGLPGGGGGGGRTPSREQQSGSGDLPDPINTRQGRGISGGSD
jgi:hypothetical protein